MVDIGRCCQLNNIPRKQDLKYRVDVSFPVFGYE